MYKVKRNHNQSPTRCPLSHFQQPKSNLEKSLDKIDLNQNGLTFKLTTIINTYSSSQKETQDLKNAIHSAFLEGADINCNNSTYAAKISKNSSEAKALNSIINDITNNSNLSAKEKILASTVVGMNLEQEINKEHQILILLQTYSNSSKDTYDLNVTITQAIYAGTNLNFNSEQENALENIDENKYGEKDAFKTLISNIVENRNLTIKEKITEGVKVGMNLAGEIQAKLDNSSKRLSR